MGGRTLSVRQRPRWSLPSDGYSRLGLGRLRRRCHRRLRLRRRRCCRRLPQYDRMAATRPGWQYQTIECGVGWTRARATRSMRAGSVTRFPLQCANCCTARACARRCRAWLARRSHHGAASIRPLSWPQTRPGRLVRGTAKHLSRCAGTNSGNSALYLPVTAATTTCRAVLAVVRCL